jgi:hypothetical protein
MERQQRMSGEKRLLDPVRVRLDASADSRDSAVEAAVSLLRDDPRIASWDEFRPWIGPKQVMDLEGSGGGVVLVHGRSAAVKDMALSALRWNSHRGHRHESAHGSVAQLGGQVQNHGHCIAVARMGSEQ